jgi:hypothetical protein
MFIIKILTMPIFRDYIDSDNTLLFLDTQYLTFVAEEFMKFSHTLKTSASPEKIWAIWTDVARWSAWDTELLDSHLESAFVLGAVGKLTPKTGRVSPFIISQLSAGNSYTFTLKLPLCKLNVYTLPTKFRSKDYLHFCLVCC